MKRRIVTALIAAAVVASVTGCGNSEFNQAYKEAQEEVDRQAAEMQEEIDTQVEDMVNGSGDEASENAPKTEQKDDEASEKEEKSSESEDSTSAPATGSYEVDGIDVTYYATVHNDKAGNWRLAVIYDGSDLNGYVADFYKKFVTDDSEVFGIVNLGLKTTTRVSRIMEDWLDVSVMEYQDGEEHDANMLFGGDELQHYWINAETGEIDTLED